MHRIRRFLRLPGRDRALLRRAAGWVVLARLGLWLLPFRVVEAQAERLGRPSRNRRRVGPVRAVWAVETVAGSIPGASCLTQALAAAVMLRRSGFTPQIRTGVAKDRHSFEAHAWLELDGQVVVGDHDLQRFTPPHPAGEDG